MSTQTTSTGPQGNKVLNYIKGVRAELKKVSWPTSAELKNYTTVVLVTCTVFGIGLYAVDSVFHLGLKLLIK